MAVAHTQSGAAGESLGSERNSGVVRRTIPLGPGRSLQVAQCGEGADILLIHGALTSGQDWLGDPMNALAPLGRVMAIDRPGHGGSMRHRFEGAPHIQAQQIHDGLRAVGIERPIVVGHSFGGLVALAYAEMFAEEVAALVLVAPIAFPEVRVAEQTLYGLRAAPVLGPLWSSLMAATLDRAMIEAAHRLMFAPHAPPPSWRENYSWTWMLSGAAGVSNGEDAAALHPLADEARIDFGRISAPVYVLQGKRDLIVSPALHARPLVERLRNAHLVEVEEAGHMLHQTRPDLLGLTIARLVGST